MLFQLLQQAVRRASRPHRFSKDHIMLRMIVSRTDKKRARVATEDLKFFDDLFDAGIKNISIEDLLNAIVGVYQRRFTVADIDALAAFEATPAGIKLHTGQQELLSLMMQATDPKQGKLLAIKKKPAHCARAWNLQTRYQR